VIFYSLCVCAKCTVNYKVEIFSRNRKCL